MGLWECLIGSGPAQGKEASRLLPELLASYREEARLARQIRNHAEHAPNQAGTQLLQAVAEEQDQLVQLLRDKIIALGGEAVNDAGPSKGGKNHWTRVVHDIEENRVLERRYLEQATYWDPDFPDTTALFRTLEREKGRLNALLHDIALRADPHALD
ncbi:MAG: hypothetical protein ACRERD_10130 [Candidatus Binatia bacterium]